MTIKDIARLSGCGVATVSRVLNNHPDVSDETRQKVMAVVEEQGFQPNNNAKHLKQQASSNIVIVVKGTMNMLFADLVEKIQALLRDAEQDAAVFYLDEDANEVLYALQLNRERRPRGFIFLGGDPELFREDFASITVPCVLLTNTAQELGFQNLSSFTTDDSRAAEEVIRVLAGQGHRHIGVVGGSDSLSQGSYRRLMGSQNACKQLGLPFDADLQYEPCRYALPDAYAAAQKLLKRCPSLTAIFAISDVTAMGVIRALRDMGKRVPEDISVVGCDGIVTGQYFLPRLTTIRQDTQRLAERGVETLLRAIFISSRPVHEWIPFELIEGESVARLPESQEGPL